MSNVKDFKMVMAVAETILNEIKIEMDSDGIRFRGLDGGHTSFFEANFKDDYFDTYELMKIDNIIIDTNELNKILKRVKNDNDTTITIDNDVLTIEIDSNGNNKTFKLNGVDMEYESPTMPNIHYPVNINLNFKEFKENVTDSSLYEDKLRVKVQGNNLIIHNKSMFGSYESNIQLDDEYDDCSSIFSMELVNKLFKLTTLTNDLNINMGTDMPMLFCLDNDYEDLAIKYLIAPRIEE